MINNEESFLITEFKTEREEDLNKRLDIFVSEKLNITRSQLFKLYKSKRTEKKIILFIKIKRYYNYRK